MVRRCVFGCSPPQTLFSFPKTPWLRARWLDFIHFEESGVSESSRLCAKHFSVDCFRNYTEHQMGFVSLSLTDNAVPSVYTVGASPTLKDSVCRILPAVRDVASQTDPPERKSVGTQLSRALKTSFRSTATQAKVPSRNCGVCTLTFPLDSPLLFLQPTLVKRPSKRPRLSLTDEEEGPSESSLSMVVHKPEDST